MAWPVLLPVELVLLLWCPVVPVVTPVVPPVPMLVPPSPFPPLLHPMKNSAAPNDEPNAKVWKRMLSIPREGLKT